MRQIVVLGLVLPVQPGERHVVVMVDLLVLGLVPLVHGAVLGAVVAVHIAALAFMRFVHVGPLHAVPLVHFILFGISRGTSLTAALVRAVFVFASFVMFLASALPLALASDVLAIGAARRMIVQRWALALFGHGINAPFG